MFRPGAFYPMTLTLLRRWLSLMLCCSLLALAGCGPGEDTGDDDGGGEQAAPVITTQPVSGASDGSTAYVLQVVASGGGLSYQWYLGTTAIDGATASRYAALVAGSYTVAVRNSLGEVRSTAAVVTVSVDPVIVVQPLSTSITNGRNARLAVVATGQALSYQWYRDNVAIVGATGANVVVRDAGVYHVVVSSNRSGAVPVTSAEATLSLAATAVAPAVTGQPTALTVAAGRLAYFSVAASGTDLQYAWYKDGVVITGATGPVYVVDAAAVVNQGSYHVVVSNTVGLVSSAPAVLTVLAAGGQGSNAAVAAAAQAFLDTLSSSQKSLATSGGATTTVLFPFSAEIARAWSSLPGARQGLRLNTDTLSAAQLAAADRLISTALSAQGATQVSEIRLADDVQAARTQSNVYGTALYSIAMLGQPSATAPWMLQIGGHMLAHNLSYNTPQVGATPMFLGSRPPHWTLSSAGAYNLANTATSSGTPHAPLQAQRTAVAALAAALRASDATAAAARLAQTVTALVRAPDATSDTSTLLPYPTGTTGRGVRVDALDATQQAAVRSAIEAWVKTQPADVAQTLLQAYLADDALAATYVAYGNGTGGSPDFSEYPNASALPASAANAYLRIDGPRVWIEFLVRGESTQLSSPVYYTSVWRDKLADYGGRF